MEEWKVRLTADIDARLKSNQDEDSTGGPVYRVDILCGIVELMVSELHDTDDPDFKAAVKRDKRATRIVQMMKDDLHPGK